MISMHNYLPFDSCIKDPILPPPMMTPFVTDIVVNFLNRVFPDVVLTVEWITPKMEAINVHLAIIPKKFTDCMTVGCNITQVTRYTPLVITVACE